MVKDLLPQRKSPRADFIDYSAGDFFVTICTQNKVFSFGIILDSNMQFTELGRYCNEQIGGISEHYPYAIVRESVVMPNHLHLIITIDVETYLHLHPDAELPQKRDLLPIVIGGFKAAISRYANARGIEFVWQERFHDHAIRNRQDGNNIARYIKTNISRWTSDCFHPRNFVK